MSFLGDIVNSIGGDKVPAPPLRPPNRPPGSNIIRSNTDAAKVVPRVNPPAASIQNGLKRKAEDDEPRPTVKMPRPNPGPGLTSTVRRAAAPPLNAPKPRNDILPVPTSNGQLSITPKLPLPRSTMSAITTVISNPVVKPATISTTTSAKPPIKGSYADLMARASQGQQQNQNKVGMIKHQATNKEKTSKLAERKKQEEDRIKTEAAKGKSGARLPTAKDTDRKRTGSPSKKPDQTGATRPGKPISRAPTSTYKGTMGAASGRGRPVEKKRSRNNEYMDTDEEDEDDFVEYDEDEEEKYRYNSESESDMEAGAFDVDEEEREAERLAKAEDARELALEQKLKREKEERRKRLEGIANKRK